MMDDLKKKVERAIKLIQAAAKGHDVIEVSYSGGKDSDVILELTKMAGVPYRAIYKNTTIDPKGTIAHALRKGAEVINPEKTFMQIIEQKGFPTMRARFCCEILKEYKVLDVAVQGIRRCESSKRAARYNEPELCRNYGGKRGKARIILPILEWTDDDVLRFVKERNIELHPLYYRNDGTIDVSRRLGCQCCPLKSDRGLAEFKANPRMVKMWLKAGLKWWDTHPNIASKKNFSSIYELFVQGVFFSSYQDFTLATNHMFGKVDCKKFLEDYFSIELK
jgi:phosphoadenosine phosphosulfate reductase